MAVVGEVVEDFVSALVPDVGFWFFVPSGDPGVVMEAVRSRTERCVPRLIHFVVSSANQRSTRFSQEL